MISTGRFACLVEMIEIKDKEREVFMKTRSFFTRLHHLSMLLLVTCFLFSVSTSVSADDALHYQDDTQEMHARTPIANKMAALREIVAANQLEMTYDEASDTYTIQQGVGKRSYSTAVYPAIKFHGDYVQTYFYMILTMRGEVDPDILAVAIVPEKTDGSYAPILQFDLDSSKVLRPEKGGIEDIIHVKQNRYLFSLGTKALMPLNSLTDVSNVYVQFIGKNQSYAYNMPESQYEVFTLFHKLWSFLLS